MAPLLLRGVFPPMMTPFQENGDVDYDAFVWNIERWNTFALAGYVALGSNSETAYLSEEEKLQCIKLTVQAAAREKVIIAGTGAESTRNTIRLTDMAAKEGVHAALVLTPSYYTDKMDDRALINYFTQVADNSGIPIILYNVPKFTHVTISVNVAAALSQHPNIIGMKDSSGDVPRLSALMRVVKKDFNLIIGTASAWLPGIALGLNTGIMALANFAPQECIDMLELYCSGEHQKANELYLRLLPVNTAVTATYGVAGLKFSADLLGYTGGTVRSPLQQLIDAEKMKMREILSAAKLI
jgi:4-hydroxy-2-oxoglutarate aldolase